jgi:hypothetical protein
VRLAVGAAGSLAWNVASRVAVGASLSFAWFVTGVPKFAGGLRVRLSRVDLPVVVGAELRLLWGVGSSVGSDLRLGWRVCTPASTALVAAWRLDDFYSYNRELLLAEIDEDLLVLSR